MGEQYIQEMKLTGSNAKIIRNDYTQTTTIASGGSETITIAPPTNKVWRVKHLTFVVGTIDTALSGIHEVELKFATNDGSAISRIILARSNFDASVSIFSSVVSNGNNLIYPTSEIAQQNSLFNAEFTNSLPLVISYLNSTDVSQTKARTIKIAFREETIA
jgi:hypothetical protein